MFATEVTVPSPLLALGLGLLVFGLSFWGLWLAANKWLLPWIDAKIEKAAAKARAKVHAEYGQDDHSGSEQ